MPSPVKVIISNFLTLSICNLRKKSTISFLSICWVHAHAIAIYAPFGVTVEYLVTGTDSSKKNPASIEPEIDNEIRQLIKAIKSLPKAKQRIVIKNALHLAGSMKET
jgi:hypothetical protein